MASPPFTFWVVFHVFVWFVLGGVFRGSGRDLLLPMAAKVGKNAIQTCGLKIRPRYGFLILIPCTTRLQYMVGIEPYDELAFFLRRCRSCAATVEAEALFGVGISGSGAVAETVL